MQNEAGLQWATGSWGSLELCSVEDGALSAHGKELLTVSGKGRNKGGGERSQFMLLEEMRMARY